MNDSLDWRTRTCGRKECDIQETCTWETALSLEYLAKIERDHDSSLIYQDSLDFYFICLKQ